jgi:hypothetical protein
MRLTQLLGKHRSLGGYKAPLVMNVPVEHFTTHHLSLVADRRGNYPLQIPRYVVKFYRFFRDQSLLSTIMPQ